MTKTDKLYETLGELLYVLALADGVIQNEEKDALEHLFQNHPWGKDIKWSFDYEVAKNSHVEDVYKKVIDTCHNHGPAPEYERFIEAMKFVAKAAEGVHKNEKGIIKSFSQDLLTRLKKDLEKELSH